MANLREVWQDVEVHLELAVGFDPETFEYLYPGLSLVLAELLLGPPRLKRDSLELLAFGNQKSFEVQLPRLRFHLLETRQLGQALDRLFTALEFDIVGHKIISIPPPSMAIQLPQGWRARSGVWLCHRPLAS